MRFKKIRGFKKADFKESAVKLKNPGCGFYHIYTLPALPRGKSVSLNEEIWFYDNAENESLALALIDIGEFKSSPLPNKALYRIDSVLNFFRQNNKQIILRFTYDTRGNCTEREPNSISVVKTHIEQAADLIREYSDDILVNQGLFIGNWGEMHGSDFSGDKSVCELAKAFYRHTRGKCFLALRTPAHIRNILHNTETLSKRKDNFALFNDAMFASPTDLGTYAEPGSPDSGYLKKQTRKREIEWQHKNLAHSPNGGEAAAGNNPIGFEDAAREMNIIHTSYLNSAYSKVQLDYWKKQTAKEGIWSGISGYEYIGRHLGYRFCVRDAFLGKGQELNIEIENSGFANLTKKADLILKVESKGGEVSERKLDTDPRYWISAEKTIVKTGISLQDKTASGSRLFISLKLQNGTPVFFANEGATDRLKLGEFMN